MNLMTDSQNVIPFTGGGALISPEDRRTALQNMRGAAPVVAGDRPILKLAKSGIWLYGVDETDVQENSQWAANPDSICHGYVAWKEGSLEGQVMVPMHESPPRVDQLPTITSPRGWQFQYSINLMCLTGEDKGTEVIYPTNSVGGVRAHKKLHQDILRHLDDDLNTPCPVIHLEVDSYVHKEFGTIYVPTLTIVSWLAMEGPQAEAVAEEENGGEPEVATTVEPPQAAVASRPRRWAAVSDETVTPQPTNPDKVVSESGGGDEATSTAPRRRRRRNAAD